MGEISDFQKIEFSLWIAVFVIMVILAYYFIKRSKKESVPKTFNEAAGIIFLGLAGMRILTIIYDFFDYGEIDFLPFLGNAFLFLGALPLVLYMEKNVIKKTKYILSAVAVAFFIYFIYIAFATNFERSALYFWAIPSFILELFILAIGYLYLIIKSTGSIRTSSILIIIGVFLIISFWVLHRAFGPLGENPLPIIQDYLAIISPIAIICGALITAKGFFSYT